MGNSPNSLCPIFLLLVLLVSGCTSYSEEVKIHYPRHSSFIIEFNKNATILCNYGKENAYLEWVLDSPIYDANEAEPDIITYSHYHADHFDHAH